VAVVIDASALVNLLIHRPASSLVRNELASEDVSAPAHIDAEILHALFGLVRGKVIDEQRARLAVKRLQRMPIARAPLPPLLDEALALRHNLSGYDALYVALARQLNCSLLTADFSIATAPRLGISVTLIGEA
jgi:predicted nucleic acid-binding protein